MNVMYPMRTFSSDTRSEACSNVRPEISSTICFTLGSVVVWAVGGGGVDLEEGSAAVAKHLDVVAILE